MDLTCSGQSHSDCEKVHELISRIGDRWTLRVVVLLRAEPLRFNQIRRSIDSISHQMLSRTLKALERDGMITRTVRHSVPPQVEYALTPLGYSLAEAGLQLGSWAAEHIAAIDRNRALYDALEETG